MPLTGPRATLALLVLFGVACAACDRHADARVLTFSGSAVGAEADVLRRQLNRFAEQNPGLDVELRVTPDAADQRHQLYVQWLNGYATEPDVLQLDIVWTAEFAAAGWLLPLDRFRPDATDFWPAAIDANRWNGTLYAIPWFVDIGLLYWRTDLMESPPQSLAALSDIARRAIAGGAVSDGLLWQGARYEGLVTVFLEHLAAFGGRMLDDGGRVVIDQPAGIQALTFMRDALAADGFVPPSVLTWQEEHTRLAFQNGDAAFMRNWPYAWALLQDPAQSPVAGRVSITPFPRAEGGTAAATLGGAQLAVNARSVEPALAWALVEFLTAPEQMLERARRASQLPARRSLYDTTSLTEALSLPAPVVRDALAIAVARPVTPVYSELSEILQVRLHRALTSQQTATDALRDAAQEMRALLARSGL